MEILSSVHLLFVHYSFHHSSFYLYGILFKTSAPIYAVFFSLIQPVFELSKCNVKLRKLSAHKSHVRETSLFTSPIGLPIVQSAIANLRFGARSKSGKVKPGKQRGATVAVCEDGAGVEPGS